MGTSMATPHVAGAFALVKGAFNTATVAEIENALKTTGKMIKDTKNNVTKPRINVDDAIVSFGTGNVSAIISPANALADGAQWSIDGGTWKNSGDTVSDLSLGEHTIRYKSITNSSSGQLWVTPAIATATINTDSETVVLNATYSETPQTTTKFDFFDDGKANLLWRSSVDGKIAVWQMDGYFVNSYNYVQAANGTAYAPSYTDWHIVSNADFDGDGKADILWRNSRDGKIAIWTMDGSVVTSLNYVQAGNGTVYAPSYTDWHIVGNADFNGDGKADMLWRNSRDGKTAVWIMNNYTVVSTNYAQSAGGTIYSVVYGDWHVVGNSDFDGDGKADILWRNSRDGKALIWKMNEHIVSSMDYAQSAGGSVFALPYSDWRIVGNADFNGDGKADILWRSVINGKLALWTMNEHVVTSMEYAQSSDGFIYAPSYSDWRVAGNSDFNGDGKKDLVWINLKDGTVAIWMMDRHIVSYTGAAQSNTGNLFAPDSALWDFSLHE
jgi:hypothetical protein